MRGDHAARAKPPDSEATTRALVAAAAPLRAGSPWSSRRTAPTYSTADDMPCVARAAESAFDEISHTYAETLDCLRKSGLATRPVPS